MPTKKTASKKDTLMDKVLLLGSSLAYLTKGATDEMIDVLEKNKVISTKEGKAAVEKMRTDLKSRQAEVQKKVTKELTNVFDQLGLATKKDLEKLQKKSAAPKKTTKKVTKKTK